LLKKNLPCQLRGRGIFFRKVLSFSPPCSGEGAYKKPPEAASRGMLIKKQNGNGHTEKQSAPGMTDNTDRRPSQGFKEKLSIEQFKI
jgi:hypothetical protein